MTGAISALIEKVEGIKAGEALLWDDYYPLIVAAFPYKTPEDLDTAKLHLSLWGAIYGGKTALLEAVSFTEAALPGCSWTLTSEGEATVQRADDVFNQEAQSATAPTPALALVLAALRAIQGGVRDGSA